MNTFPGIINIHLFDSNSKKAISNILVTIKLFAKHKNNYNFILPLSNEKGCIEITKNWIKEEIKKDQSLFVMDYSSTLEECASKIEIEVLSEEALSRTVNAMYLFQSVTGITDEEIHIIKKCDNFKYFPKTFCFILDDTDNFEIEIFIESKDIIVN